MPHAVPAPDAARDGQFMRRLLLAIALLGFVVGILAAQTHKGLFETPLSFFAAGCFCVGIMIRYDDSSTFAFVDVLLRIVGVFLLAILTTIQLLGWTVI